MSFNAKNCVQKISCQCPFNHADFHEQCLRQRGWQISSVSDRDEHAPLFFLPAIAILQLEDRISATAYLQLLTQCCLVTAYPQSHIFFFGGPQLFKLIYLRNCISTHPRSKFLLAVRNLFRTFDPTVNFHPYI